MWFLPAMPLLYGCSQARWSDPRQMLLVYWTPWVLCSFASVMISYALWRIEVNVAGNRLHPFTPKDQKVLRLALASTTGVMLAMLVINMIHIGGITAEQRTRIDGAVNVVMISMLMASVLMASMERIHVKGKQAYDELEKGV
jgi:hypothetical protein